MEQTLPDVEYIFVDDCSPDGSMDIVKWTVEEYPERVRQVLLQRHEVNKGLPSARNTGLQLATGEYVYHCDSDDYLEKDALERMLTEAEKTDSDIVYTDWYLSYPHSERYMPQPPCDSAESALRSILHGTMKYNVWNKLVKRSMYLDHGINFPDGHSMGEDMTMIMLFAHARKVVHLAYGTYHYIRQNENAFTVKRPTEASYTDLYYNAQRVIDYLQGRVDQLDIDCFKLNVKFPFLISNDQADYERWNKWFPEANAAIDASSVSMRMRWLQKTADHKRYSFLKTYNILHQKLYGFFFQT